MNVPGGMKRRALLGGAAIGAGVLACPSWIARAFGQVAAGAELAALSDAYRRAQRAGRPLLVLIIPAQQEARWDRAQAFGELLNHGPESVLADLALAEVACATMSTLRTLVPQAGSGEPLMVLVEPEAVPATARGLRAELPTMPEYWVFSEETSWDERVQRENAVIDQRIAVLAGVVHRALAPDAATISQRAALARARLSAGDRARVEAAIRAGRVTSEVAALAPAMIAEAASARPTLGSALVELGTERWRRGRIPGSRWAVGGGCGTQVEETEEERARGDGDQRMMVACGMGHVPERSARFLDWYTAT